METPIKFTYEAFKDCNIEQAATVLHLTRKGERTVEVMKDFSLPAGYLAFKDGFVYGGIDPEGKVST